MHVVPLQSGVAPLHAVPQAPQFFVSLGMHLPPQQSLPAPQLMALQTQPSRAVQSGVVAPQAWHVPFWQTAWSPQQTPLWAAHCVPSQVVHVPHVWQSAPLIPQA
jgi:hypothetical protein